MPSIKQFEYDRLRFCEEGLKEARNTIYLLELDIKKQATEIRILKSYISGRKEE